MKIIVAIKQVPARDSSLKVSGDGKWVQEADLTYEINEPDAYALEEALQLKEKHGGEVVVLCLGPERAGQTIREALAKGADRAIHVEEENANSLDTLGVAKLLAKAVADEQADLVLTGLQSDDLGAGQSCVLGTPAPENEEWSASLRRNLRRLLKEAEPNFRIPADARALVVLGASTYAGEEKLSLSLRGMDPALYAGYDILVVMADGVLKTILQPQRQTLPWDAPL